MQIAPERLEEPEELILQAMGSGANRVLKWLMMQKLKALFDATTWQPASMEMPVVPRVQVGRQPDPA
jgi:hypothetical protein